MKKKPVTKSDCGAANLLAKIFDVDLGETKERLGIPNIEKKCLNCGKTMKNQNRFYCSRDCQHKHKMIGIICEFCGKKVKRSQSQLISRRAKNYFCSKECHYMYRRKKLFYLLANKLGITREEIDKLFHPKAAQ